MNSWSDMSHQCTIICLQNAKMNFPNNVLYRAVSNVINYSVSTVSGYIMLICSLPCNNTLIVLHASYLWMMYFYMWHSTRRPDEPSSVLHWSLSFSLLWLPSISLLSAFGIQPSFWAIHMDHLFSVAGLGCSDKRNLYGFLLHFL